MPNEKPNPDDTLSKVLAYVDSHGLLSLAVNGGSAEERVQATAGEVVAIARQS